MEPKLSLMEIPVPGGQLCGLTWRDRLLWFSDAELDQIVGMDPKTGRVVRHIECPEVRTGLTAVDGNLLQVAGLKRVLRLIDFKSGETIREFPNPRDGIELCDIEATASGIWLGYEDPPMLDFRSPQTFELIDSIPVAEPVAGVTVVGECVAYSSYTTAHLHLIDPRKKRVLATIDVSGNPTGLTWDGRLLWYCDYTNVTLRAIKSPMDMASNHSA
jgi:glutamine cyclotransferase